ncbi:hypothetical protein CROQUDRAFT_702954 [Cronartium quercuum f. sp. fusiforme G11]|uniref:Uncharacterized protein n=1 Tax=Cronartium quercuum f. sp. fusiforme G11 TaxID=708437 RepID=A0A9P6NLL7_9BASI|nr:hypothetical protein CROQUDRAFT_702954 [Cronartium quercuum f. sp. fusiforme G11]
MIAFACIRCHSGMQLQNSLQQVHRKSLIACGVTEKINGFLKVLGLTLSQRAANEALNTLKEQTEDKIKSVAAETHKF